MKQSISRYCMRVLLIFVATPLLAVGQQKDTVVTEDAQALFNIEYHKIESRAAVRTAKYLDGFFTIFESNPIHCETNKLVESLFNESLSYLLMYDTEYWSYENKCIQELIGRVSTQLFLNQNRGIEDSSDVRRMMQRKLICNASLALLTGGNYQMDYYLEAAKKIFAQDEYMFEEDYKEEVYRSLFSLKVLMMFKEKKIAEVDLDILQARIENPEITLDEIAYGIKEVLEKK